MVKQFSLKAVLTLLVITVAITASAVWALTTLKTIHGTALVTYKGDISITDFKFVDENTISVTISTSISPTPACTIYVSGAGISGSKTISAGWVSPYTVLVPITGTLTSGTITIEVR